MDCTKFKNHECRSCDLLDMTYQDSLFKKEQELLKLFEHNPLSLEKTVGLKNPHLPSRNKMKLAVNEKDGELTFGFYKSDMSFVELENCPLHLDGLNSLIPLLKKALKEFRIPAYQLKTQSGELKYVIISQTKSEFTQYLIRFVLRSKESLDRLRKLSLSLQEKRSDIKVITANLQPEHKAVFEGEVEIILTEQSHITQNYGAMTLSLGARSFFQVTPEIAEQLYKIASDWVKEFSIESFLDLYCGVGAFSFALGKNAKRVMGVELSPQAIDEAIRMKEINGPHVDFKSADVLTFLKSNKESFDALCVNPPRRGLGLEIIEHLKTIKPDYILYSSCNAQTLKDDFDHLKEHYSVLKSQIFDMFPFTHHYETLMLLKRRVHNG
jgi:23S rRNA (uracil747-C5)-methyltransferase